MKSEYKFGQIDRNSYKPIYIQVSEMIIDYTRASGLKHGDTLPSENELLSKLDVSRNTIRLAVDRLVKMDFATKIRGQGTFLKEKVKHTVNLDLTQGFEGALNLLGIKVDNKLIEKRAVKERIQWVDGLSTVKSDKTVLIRRLKLASGKILALEDRILPAHVPDRYSEKELEEVNINPNLLERYPDTETKRMKYYFVSHPLTQEENELLKVAKATPFLQRIGEYFNSVGDCFMVGRHIFVSELIDLSYEFEKKDDSWILTS
jgi:DNA-binding GntR family transcriptional regulator